MACIRQEVRDGIAVVTIDNPARRNAFTAAMTRALGQALEAAEADDAVRCVVLTGEGDAAFSSGHDIAEMLEDREGASDPALNAPFVRPESMLTPVIAAVNGPALGAGFILALACDLRVCAENASFTAPGARIGLLPVGGQISRLPGLVPPAVAYDMMASCRALGAEEAHRYGFAGRLAPRGGALAEALRWAGQIAANSPSVVRAVKAGLRVGRTGGHAAADAYEWRVARELQDGPDAREGLEAFLEKRPARFS